MKANTIVSYCRIHNVYMQCDTFIPSRAQPKPRKVYKVYSLYFCPLHIVCYEVSLADVRVCVNEFLERRLW